MDSWADSRGAEVACAVVDDVEEEEEVEEEEDEKVEDEEEGKEEEEDDDEGVAAPVIVGFGKVPLFDEKSTSSPQKIQSRRADSVCDPSTRNSCLFFWPCFGWKIAT